MKELFKRPLLVIMAFFGALNIINLGNVLLPNLIQWLIFIEFLLEFTGMIRDFFLLPIIYPLKKLFQITLPVWFRSYFFIGLLLIS